MLNRASVRARVETVDWTGDMLAGGVSVCVCVWEVAGGSWLVCERVLWCCWLLTCISLCVTTVYCVLGQRLCASAVVVALAWVSAV